MATKDRMDRDAFRVFLLLPVQRATSAMAFSSSRSLTSR